MSWTTERSLRRVAVVLALLVLAAAGALAWSIDRAREGDRVVADVATADAAAAEVVSEDAKREVRDVAAEAAARVYSWSWDTVATDKSAARELLTADMVTRYDRTMAGVATASAGDHTVVRATVADTALVTVGPTRARVLVFVNRGTDGDQLDRPRLDLDRVLVTLASVDGRWLVSELDAL